MPALASLQARGVGGNSAAATTVNGGTVPRHRCPAHAGHATGTHNHQPQQHVHQNNRQRTTHRPKQKKGMYSYLHAKINHNKDMCEQLLQFKREGHLCDAVIVAAPSANLKPGETENGKRILAHRSILAAVSRYFEARFTSREGLSAMDKKGKVELIIEGVDTESLEALVEFCYTGKVDISVSNVKLLLEAASLLQLDEVKEAATDYLKKLISPLNCLSIRDYAAEHGFILLRIAADLVSFKSFEHVVTAGTEYLELSIERLHEILKSKLICVSSERVIYGAILTWTMHQPAERHRYFDSLLKEHVRLELLPLELLRTALEKNNFILADAGCKESFSNAIATLESHAGHTKPCQSSGAESSASVLFAVGGCTADGSPCSIVERLDAGSKSWQTVSSMVSPRKWPGVASSGGLLYVVGGFHGRAHTATVEQYDPTANKWYTGCSSMSTARIAFGCGQLGGKIYSVGGFDGNTILADCEFYDPGADKWMSSPSLGCPRALHGFAVLDNSIYVASGVNCYDKTVSTVERFDPRTNSWSWVAPLTLGRQLIGLVSTGQELYAIGLSMSNLGLCPCVAFDPRAGRWRPNSQVALIRRYAASVSMFSGRIAVVAGCERNSGSAVSHVELFDPNQKFQKTLAPSMAVPRKWLGVSLLNV